MSEPPIDYSTLTSDTQSPETPGQVDYSQLTSDKHVEKPGPIDTLENAASTTWEHIKKLADILTAEEASHEDIDESKLTPAQLYARRQVLAARAKSNTGESAQKAASDVLEGAGDIAGVFAMTPTRSAKSTAMLQHTTEAAKNLFKEQKAEISAEGIKYPWEKAIGVEKFFAGIPDFFVTAADDGVQAMTGVSSEDFHALTVDERSQVIKNTAANIAVAAVAKGLHSVLPDATMKPFHQAANGIAEGIVGGSVYSAINQANTTNHSC